MWAWVVYLARILNESSLAVVGNATGRTVRTGKKDDPAAFSIRRLGGSRWCSGGRGVLRDLESRVAWKSA